MKNDISLLLQNSGRKLSRLRLLCNNDQVIDPTQQHDWGPMVERFSAEFLLFPEIQDACLLKPRTTIGAKFLLKKEKKRTSKNYDWLDEILLHFKFLMKNDGSACSFEISRFSKPPKTVFCSLKM